MRLTSLSLKVCIGNLMVVKYHLHTPWRMSVCDVFTRSFGYTIVTAILRKERHTRRSYYLVPYIIYWPLVNEKKLFYSLSSFTDLWHSTLKNVAWITNIFTSFLQQNSWANIFTMLSLVHKGITYVATLSYCHSHSLPYLIMLGLCNKCIVTL